VHLSVRIGKRPTFDNNNFYVFEGEAFGSQRQSPRLSLLMECHLVSHLDPAAHEKPPGRQDNDARRRVHPENDPPPSGVQAWNC
jgi:hypothetical protein